MNEPRKYHLANTWHGPELAARGGWVHEFTEAEIDELAAAADAVMDQDTAQLRADAFDLPRLDPVLARNRAVLLDGRGFVVLRGLPVQDWPMARIVRSRACGSMWHCCANACLAKVSHLRVISGR